MLIALLGIGGKQKMERNVQALLNSLSCIERQDADAIFAIIVKFLKGVNGRTGPLERKWTACFSIEAGFFSKHELYIFT